jgi:hypothetical protein
LLKNNLQKACKLKTYFIFCCYTKKNIKKMEVSNTTTATETTAAKPKNYYLDVAEFIAVSETALINAALPAIATKLDGIGYTPLEIATKLEELQTLKDLNEKQKKEYGDQFEATVAYTAAEELLHSTYMNHLTFARVIFKDDIAAQVSLGLNGQRKITNAGYKEQALLMYDAILKNSDYQDKMAKRGITKAALTAQQDAFKGLSALAANKKKETGEAQAATKIRDAALHTFEVWMGDFKELAIVALSNTPQMREQLGWKE